MDHRLFAILAIVCLAMEGAGCASESARANREEILMPLQTGSVIQRRVVVESTPVTKKPKKKKKEAKEKDETKRESPKPIPAPESTPKAEPEETPAAAPERFR